jgi:hypothetical protein
MGGFLVWHVRHTSVYDALCFHGQNTDPITGITPRSANDVFSAL